MELNERIIMDLIVHDLGDIASSLRLRNKMMAAKELLIEGTVSREDYEKLLKGVLNDEG